MNGPKLSFFGNLTRDPELRFTADNAIPYVRVTIATNRYRGPEQEPDTYYINTTFWRSHANRVANSCERGQRIYVEGAFSQHTYDRDGVPTLVTDVTANEIEILPRSAAAIARAAAEEEPPEPTNTADQAVDDNQGEPENDEDSEPENIDTMPL